MSKDICDYEGHPDEVIAVQWHPHKEEIFASACKAGQISFWKQNYTFFNKEQNKIQG